MFWRFDPRLKVGDRLEEGDGQHHDRFDVLSGASPQPISKQNIAGIERRIFQRVRFLVVRGLQQQNAALFGELGVQPSHVCNRFQELAPRADEPGAHAIGQTGVEFFIGAQRRIQRHRVEERIAKIAGSERERDCFSFGQQAPAHELAGNRAKKSAAARPCCALGGFRFAAPARKRGIIHARACSFLRGRRHHFGFGTDGRVGSKAYAGALSKNEGRVVRADRRPRPLQFFRADDDGRVVGRRVPPIRTVASSEDELSAFC